MGDSFFTSTKDAVLDAGASNFSTRITATPTAFGLVAGDATAYAAVYATWQAAYAAVLSLGTRSKSVVQTKNDARIPLRQMSSDLAKKINGTKTVTNTQKIDLGLSVRPTPTPVGAPGKPFDFSVALGASGSLELAWKCKNPRGATNVTYNVFRRTTATGDYTFVGSAGLRKFVDATVPAGVASITYQIQAIRSTGAGPWAQYNVNFGAGGATVSTEETKLKAA